jgi:hypothetical protein
MAKYKPPTGKSKLGQEPDAYKLARTSNRYTGDRSLVETII